MAVSTQEIQNYLAANPGLTDAQIVAAMNQYSVTPEQMAQATGVPLSEVTSRYEAIRPNYSTRYANVADEVAGAPGEQYIYGYSGPIGADDMYSAYSPTGEFLGRYKTEDDWWKPLIPLGAAAAGQFLFGGGLGGAGAAGAEALGQGAWLGEGVASGIPAWDAAALSAGNTLTGVSPALLDAQFIAADAAQLAAQTGNNVAAIQQNLIAAGVDPIVAATAADAAALGLTGSELITAVASSGQAGAGLFTGGSAADLALGGITTTTGAGAAGAAGAGIAAGAGAGTTAITAGLPATITKLLTNPSVVSTLVGATLAGGSGGGGGGGTGMFSGPGSVPTQGVPQNTPEYYQAVQRYYNQFVPNAPRDVSGELAAWYGGTFNAGGQNAQPPGMMAGGGITPEMFNQLLAQMQQQQRPLYESLSSRSSARDIANAYEQFIQGAGGDTPANQQEAIKYLKSIGVSDAKINQAYDIFKG